MKKLVFAVMIFFFLSGASQAQQEEMSSSFWQDVVRCFENVEDYLGRTDLITPGVLQQLPVGIRTTIGLTRYDLLITQAVFGPDYTEVAVYLRIEGPDWQGEDRCLYFGADKVLITSQGGFIGDVKLAMMGDVTLKGKGDMFRMRLLGKKEDGDHESSEDGLPPTYAVVNCEGFKELQISAVLEFEESAIAPVKNGKLQDEVLRTAFFVTASSLDDIIVKIDLPEFALRAVPDWRFTVSDAVFDFSQSRNAPDFDCCPGAAGSGPEAGSDELWQGVYIKELRLGFPDYIRKVDGALPSLGIRNMRIDENGFSGKIEANDVLRLDEGTLAGWGFSIREFSMEFKRNAVAGGRMKGDIELPVSKAGSYCYDAGFKTDGSWDMALSLGEKLKFEFLKAREVELYASSYLKGEKDADSGFLLQAGLWGRMKLNPMAQENDKFGFANLEFKEMVVRNKAPYFEVASIKWDDQMKFGNFPVSIKDISIHGQQDDLSIGFTTMVQFGSQNEAYFGGEMDLRLMSAFKQENGRQKWEYKGVDISEIAVDFSHSFFQFKGRVRSVREDPVYGNGFQGSMDLLISPFQAGFRGDMMIGSTPSLRYWYIDMMLRLGSAGIPVFPGFQISAIGGGAYSRMRMDGSGGGPDELGGTSSGLRYVPDSASGLGIKTSLVLSTLDPKMFSAELGFEMLFNTSGGISDAYLRGAAQLMSRESNALQRFNQKVTQLAAKIQPSLQDQRKAVASEASISAEAVMQMDFTNRVFTGNIDAYMDLGVIKGKGSKGHLGKIAMSIGGDAWYVKVGEPANPLGIRMKVGPIQADMDSYFMTGSHLPPFPGIPPRIASFLDKQTYISPDQTQLSRGSGLAFGSTFSLKTGTIPLLIFYAEFEAEIGFDLMMKQHLNTLCAETGTEPGINKWYAQGQAYAYMMTDMGLYLKLFGKKRTFSVLKGEVGCMLRAGLPNPASLMGALGVRVSILNGLVKGDFNVEFDLGQSCTMLSQGFAEGKDVIADVKPDQRDEAVDVFSIPRAAFNLPVGTVLEDEYQEKKYEIKLDQYELWYGGTRLEGKLQWSEDRRSIEFLTHDVLPSEAKIDCRLAIGAKESTGSSWKTMLDGDGNPYKEKRDYSFTTGKGPDSIPWNNVKFCYPVRDQRHYFPREYKKGFVFLERGMDYLLADPDYKKRVYVISSHDTLEASFTYNQALRRMAWHMPEGLRPETDYRLVFVLKYGGEVSLPVSQPNMNAVAAVSPELKTSSSVLYSGQGGSLEQETVGIESVSLKSDKDKIVLQYAFRTSRYASFGEKLAKTRLTSTSRTPLLYMGQDGEVHTESPDVHYLQARMESGEAFDEVERYGDRYSGGAPLIRTVADLGNEPYYHQDIYPLVYQNYPYGGAVRFERGEGREDIIPRWAVYPSQFYDSPDSDYFPWIYYLPVQYKADYDNVLRSIAERGIMGNPYYLSWLNKPFKRIRKGSYPIFLEYVLPDGTLTSRRRIVFENEAE